jgi:hypothetical protein
MLRSKHCKSSAFFNLLLVFGTGRAFKRRRVGCCTLLVGISIPIVLFVGGQYFTNQNNEKQQRLADDKASKTTLVKYFDQMADSLKDGLLKTNPGDDRFIVAQSRTVLALQSLDKKRQHLVIQFLQAAV